MTNDERRTGLVISVNISDRKGISKTPVESIVLKKDYGVENDAHGGGQRQVSVLALESITLLKDTSNSSLRLSAEALAKEEGVERRGNPIQIKPGLFAENITTESIQLSGLAVGDTIKVGETVLKLSEKGKVCPRKCSIYYKLGDCIMPREGLFFDVIKEGIVKKGDIVEII